MTKTNEETLDLEIINNDLTVHAAHIDINGYRINLHTPYDTLSSGNSRYVVITDQLFLNRECVITGKSANKGEAKIPIASNPIVVIYLEHGDPILTDDNITIMRKPSNNELLINQIEDHYWMHQAISVLYPRVPFRVPLEPKIIDVDGLEVFKPKFNAFYDDRYCDSCEVSKPKYRTSKEFADKLGAHRKAVKLIKLRGLTDSLDRVASDFYRSSVPPGMEYVDKRDEEEEKMTKYLIYSFKDHGYSMYFIGYVSTKEQAETWMKENTYTDDEEYTRYRLDNRHVRYEEIQELDKQ